MNVVMFDGWVVDGVRFEDDRGRRELGDILDRNCPAFVAVNPDHVRSVSMVYSSSYSLIVLGDYAVVVKLRPDTVVKALGWEGQWAFEDPLQRARAT